MRSSTSKKSLSAAAAIAAAVIMVSLLLLTPTANGSPEPQDKLGCHKCLKNCSMHELVQNEFHCHGINPKAQSIQTAPRIVDGKTYRRVAAIVDGDTLKVYIGGKSAVVRLLGIDSPERKECFGAQASKKLHQLAYNKFVLLEPDKLSASKDKYGRLLRYITLLGNATLNEAMLQEGYAKVYVSNISKLAYYRQLEAAAKAQGLGLWRACYSSKPTDRVEVVLVDKNTNSPLAGRNVTIKQVIYCEQGSYCSLPLLFQGKTDTQGKIYVNDDVFNYRFNIYIDGYYENGPFKKQEFDYKHGTVVIRIE